MAPRSAPSAPPGAPAASVPAPRIVGRAFSEMVARCRVGERRVNAPRFFGPWLRLIEQTVQKVACSDKRLSSSISSLFARPPAHSHPRAPCSSAPSRARPPPRTRGAGAHPPAAGVSPRSRAASTRNTSMNSVRAARQKDVSSDSLSTGLDTTRGKRRALRARPVPSRPDRRLTQNSPHHPRLPSTSLTTAKEAERNAQYLARERRALQQLELERAALADAERASPARRPVGAYPGRTRATPSSLRTTTSSWTRPRFPG